MMMMADPRTLLLTGLLALLACGAYPAAAAEEEAIGREAMADVMSRMMEAMGFLGEASRSNALKSLPNGVIGAPSGAPAWPPTLGAPPGAAGPLEGIWESPDGGLLIVQGARYRLYQPGAGYVDGALRLGDGWLTLRNRVRGIEHRFEMALQGERLALRGEGGQVFVYRRLRLDRPNPR